MIVQRDLDVLAACHTLILEFALAVAVVASGGYWPAEAVTREVQITARME